MQDIGLNNRELRRALEFTEDDLAANRQGHLTRPQLLHLIRRTVGHFLLISVLMTVFLFVYSGFRLFWPIVGYYVVLFLVMKPWLGFLGRSVKVVEGKLSKYEKSSDDPRESVTHYIEVMGLEFSVPDYVFNYFVDGLDYRIFYTPVGKLLVAAERMENIVAADQVTLG